MLDDIEDLDIFTNGEFSTIATVQSATATITELSGIFDENYQDMFGYGDTQSTEGRKFCFKVQTTQIEELRNGDKPNGMASLRLTIKNKNYLITSMQPQHDGKLTHLILKQDFS